MDSDRENALKVVGLGGKCVNTPRAKQCDCSLLQNCHVNESECMLNEGQAQRKLCASKPGSMQNKQIAWEEHLSCVAVLLKRWTRSNTSCGPLVMCAGQYGPWTTWCPSKSKGWERSFFSKVVQCSPAPLSQCLPAPASMLMPSTDELEWLSQNLERWQEMFLGTDDVPESKLVPAPN